MISLENTHFYETNFYVRVETNDVTIKLLCICIIPVRSLASEITSCKVINVALIIVVACKISPHYYYMLRVLNPFVVAWQGANIW